MEKNKYSKVEKKLGYKFADIKNLEEALYEVGKTSDKKHL